MNYAYVINGEVLKELEILTDIPASKLSMYLPLTESIPNHNADTHYPVFSSYEITNGEVIKHYTIEVLPAENKFEKDIVKGYTIPNTNIVIAITDTDRIRWMEMLMLINELLAKGAIATTTKMTIKDINGIPYSVDAGKVKDAIVTMGLHYYNLWASKG